MIGFVHGILSEVEIPKVLVEVSGIGYEIETPLSSISSLPPAGSEVKIYTRLIIREDAHLLYGFTDKMTRQIFDMLIGVSGVGPKMALSILSGYTPDEFSQLISAKDIMALTKIKGVGKKTAERLALELYDKISNLNLGIVPAGEKQAGTPSEYDENLQVSVQALIQFGYSQTDAERMAKSVYAEGKRPEEIIRDALRSAAR